MGNTQSSADTLHPDVTIVDSAKEFGMNMARAIFEDTSHTKSSRSAAQSKVDAAIKRHLSALEVDGQTVSKSVMSKVSDAVLTAAFRSVLLEQHRNSEKEVVRCDGRLPAQIRPLQGDVDVMPMQHGSSHFCRGDTAALCSVTLGTLQNAHLQNSFSSD